MKKCVIVFSLIVLRLLSVVASADVGYVLKNSRRADVGFLDVFSDMGLSVELIEDRIIPVTDFSLYDFIFVGDTRLRNKDDIPIDLYPSIIANHYYGKEFGFLTKGRIRKTSASSLLNIKKNGNIIKVYEMLSKV